MIGLDWFVPRMTSQSKGKRDLGLLSAPMRRESRELGVMPNAKVKSSVEGDLATRWHMLLGQGLRSSMFLKNRAFEMLKSCFLILKKNWLLILGSLNIFKKSTLLWAFAMRLFVQNINSEWMNQRRLIIQMHI